MIGCEQHRDTPAPQCANCALEAELRALPMVEPPADLAASVVAAIAGDDAALEARLRSLPEVDAPADLAGRVDDAIATDQLEAQLRAMPMVEPPAGLSDDIAAAVAFEPIASVLRATPMLKSPVDLAALVLDELAYEDRLRRGAVWRAGGIGLSAAAAGMLLLGDPAGIGSAAASLFDRATAYVPTAEHLGPVGELGDFAAPATPGIADRMVTVIDSAQVALSGGLPDGLSGGLSGGLAPAAGTGAEWLGMGQLWWMVLGVTALVALNGVIAKVMFRRA